MQYALESSLMLTVAQARYCVIFSSGQEEGDRKTQRSGCDEFLSMLLIIIPGRRRRAISEASAGAGRHVV